MKKIILIIMYLIMISSVTALGLAPARTQFDYDAGEKEGAFRIIVDRIPTKILLTAEGDLGRYIILDKENLVLTEPETWVKFKMDIPDSLPPGEQKGSIIVLEVPRDKSDENMVMAATAVMHQVKIDVPFPGKYVTGKMFITNSKVNEPIEFRIALKNFGSEKVDVAKGMIVVKGPTNEELGVFYTDQKTIEPNSESVLLGLWQTPNEGTYFAEAAIEYDSSDFELEQSFNVGELELAIEYIKVENFRLGQIAKLDIYLRNKWNKGIDANGRVEIFKGDKIITSFNTLPVHIDERSQNVMEAYWNTEGLEIDEYDISVKATYDGKTSEKTFSSIVSIEELKLKDYASGKVTGSRSEKNQIMLISIVVLLIILNIGLFIYINRRLKSNAS